MILDVVNQKNEKVGEVEVSDAVFGAEIKPHLHWEMVRYQQASKRRGTHATRGRGEVRGSTRKIYRQKGTGNARHGDIKAPIFVGGGTVFGPQPRNYAYRPPRSSRLAGMRSALSQKAAEGKLVVVDSFELEGPKTKLASAKLSVLGTSSAVVVDAENNNLRLSVRNLPKNKYLRTEGVNVYDLLKHDHLVITREAIQALNGALTR